MSISLEQRHQEKQADNAGCHSAPHTIWKALSVLFVAIIVLCFTPLRPRFPAARLDPAWMWAMNEAVADHLVIGRDVISTYGPYASVYTQQYHPATDTLMVLSSIFLGLSFALGAVCLASGARAWPLVVFPFIILLAQVRDPIYLAVPPMLLLITVRREADTASPLALRASSLSNVAQAVLVLSLSLLVLIKASLGLLSIALGGLCFLLQFRSNPRKAVFGALLFAVGVAGLWAASGQHLSTLPAYFMSMRPIVSGYTEAMAIKGPPYELAIFLLCAAVVLACLGYFVAWPLRLAGVVLFAGFLLTVFLAFKAGFVRHDEHAVTAFGLLLLLVAYVTFILPRSVAVPLLIATIIAWVYIDSHYTPIRTFPARLSAAGKDLVFGVEERLSGKGHLENIYQERVSAIKSNDPMPARDGTWDVYPYRQDILLANRAKWSPRPIIQSYYAYTTQLAGLNADHLKGPRAPNNILFGISPIDDRLPAIEDGLSWPPLLSLYEITEFDGDFALLRKRGEPLPQTVAPIGDSSKHTLGADISLPPGNDPIWARIIVQPSLIGKLGAVLYAPPALQIEMFFASGRTMSYRYIASMGRPGFLVSPQIRNTHDFAALVSPDRDLYFGGLRPTSIRITAEPHTGWLWSEDISVELSKVIFPVQPSVGALLMDEWSDGARAVVGNSLPAEGGHCDIERLNNMPITRAPVVVRSVSALITGWALIDGGTDSDSVYFAYVDRSRQLHAAKAWRIDHQQDVYFGRPEIERVGIEANLDVSALHGTLEVWPILVRSGVASACGQIGINVLH